MIRFECDFIRVLVGADNRRWFLQKVIRYNVLILFKSTKIWNFFARRICFGMTRMKAKYPQWCILFVVYWLFLNQIIIYFEEKKKKVCFFLEFNWFLSPYKRVFFSPFAESYFPIMWDRLYSYERSRFFWMMVDMYSERLLLVAYFSCSSIKKLVISTNFVDACDICMYVFTSFWLRLTYHPNWPIICYEGIMFVFFFTYNLFMNCQSFLNVFWKKKTCVAMRF